MRRSRGTEPDDHVVGARLYQTWSPRQFMVWDNRCTLHRATGFDEARYKRVMRRCTINGDRPF